MKGDMMGIIKSLLDSDLYKLTMCQSVLHKFPNVWVKYKFKCRNQGIIWIDEMVSSIRKEIDEYCTLKFTDEEIYWVSKLRYIKKDFVEFLRIYQPQSKHVDVELVNGELQITVEGPWFLTIFFEVPILSIVNEIYFLNTTWNGNPAEISPIFQAGKKLLQEKIDIARESKFLFSDFGTRRRFSVWWQDIVIKELAEQLPRSIFGGTSNTMFAMKYDLVPIGTMAHEYICAGQGLEGVTLASSQKYMLQAWVDEYRGDLGTALSDTLGLDKFLKDFDLYFSKLYDGVRHDSGDPSEWGWKMIAHYEKMKIDPRTKQFVWSDGLTFEKAAQLYDIFKDKAKCSFGIGTNLTNDFPGIKPLNIVMKVVEANGRPVTKLSDSPGKTMCENQQFMDYLRSVC
jgi:nicotinate phosphoribosyltransferase